MDARTRFEVFRRNRPWTLADVPCLGGRTAVVTGANTGVGYEIARVLAGRGAAVVLAVRATSSGDRAAAAIRASAPDADVTVQELDLASLASIRRAASELQDRHGRLDLLVNNAGVMWTPRSVTEDGFELQFGVNHLGHFALTGLLLERLLRVDASRVVTISSAAHWFASTIDLHELDGAHRYNGISAYAQSKLANLLFTHELQRRLHAAGATTCALAAHPGWSRTEIARNSPAPFRFAERIGRALAQAPALGAQPAVRAATDPSVVGGECYAPGGIAQLWGKARVVRSNRASRDAELARRLWDASETLTGVTFPV
jgi:NAD(P)-dependent dehydrogenase (short-subunit alcohol dehydrogenase family)